MKRKVKIEPPTVDVDFAIGRVTLNKDRPNEFTVDANEDGTYRIWGSGFAFIEGEMCLSPESGNTMSVRAVKK